MRELLPVIGSSVFFDLLKSILLLLILLIARTVLVRWIKGNHTLTIDAKRRWIVTARNSMVLGLFVGLVVIWAHELEAFAVSLVALAATVVLATKELILCWSGAALRVGGGVYGSLMDARPGRPRGRAARARGDRGASSAARCGGTSGRRRGRTRRWAPGAC